MMNHAVYDITITIILAILFVFTTHFNDHNNHQGASHNRSIKSITWQPDFINIPTSNKLQKRDIKMDSSEGANEKVLKQLKNLKLKHPKNAMLQEKNNEDPDNDNDASPSFQRIRELFKKTEEMKEMAKEKNREVESQFESLKERLNGSSAFLTQMKSSIENLRFSYQRKMMDHQEEDLEDFLNNKEKFKNKEEINSYLDELKGKIETLQTKPKAADIDESEDYQSALKNVVTNLKIIDEGLYSSGRNFGKESKM